MTKIYKIAIEFTITDNDNPPFYQTPDHCSTVLTEELKGKGIKDFEVIKSELVNK